jgi:tetratricopeptide (TPR) repeat protein
LQYRKKEQVLKVFSTLQTMRNIARSFSLLAVALSLSVVGIKTAQAHVIDRIDINHAGGEAEIHIQFDVRIQYLREASLKNGEIHVFVQLLEADPDSTSLLPEAKDSPPTDITPHFSVAYPGLDSSLTIKFDNEVSYRVRPGNDGRSISIFTPALKPKIEPQTEALPAAITPEAVEQKAKQLFDSARTALKQGQAAAAVETLNQLLNLPPNQQSQAAQELIGEAREKNGEYAKARVEYELYLKLYPDAPDVKQVKAMLANLPAEAYVKPQAVRKQTVDQRMMAYGSFSQSYYSGVFHTDTATANGANIIFDTLSGTDQSMLITSLDLTGRKLTENTDTRIVVRDDYRSNFLSNTKNDNRLSSFYVEQSGRDRSYLYRLGRQAGTAGGVLGRFDGAWLGYSLNSTWRVNGVLGIPVDFYNTDAERKTFAGLSIDLTRLPEQWSGNGYFIEQRVGSVVDRQAVGIEAHYFDTKRNYMGQLDYDRMFKEVNIAMFQGNWMNQAGDNYTLLADHRKSPTLQLTNALLGQTTQSIADALLLPGVTMESLVADAKALTPTANLLMVGMTHPYSSRLRLGGDFRINNISGTEATATLPAVPGSGNMYILTVQAIGNSLLLENDLGVASASYISAQTYKGQSLAFTQTETFRQRWRLDVSLQLYNQKDDLDVHMTRITPSLKLSYRMNESMSFDGEGGVENTHNSSPINDERIRRYYVYVGYRWDFQ